MKSKKLVSLVLLMCLVLLSTCKKKTVTQPEPEVSPLPTISTSPITSITEASAISGGAIISEGTSPIISSGICWDTIPAPDLTRGALSKTTGGTNYTCTISDLKVYKKYYVRAFATNGSGTSFGNEISFTSSDVWTKLGAPLSPLQIYSMKAKGNQVYICSSNGLLYSADAGDTWQNVGFTNSVVNSVGIGDNVVFAGVNNLIYKSMNNGTNWTLLSTNIPTISGVTDFLINSDEVYASLYDGVYFSSNKGNTWSYINNGLASGTYYFRISRVGSTIFCADGYNPVIYKTIDKGLNWNKSSAYVNGYSGQISDMICVGPNIYTSCSVGCFVSNNEGQSWSKSLALANAACRFSVSDSTVFCASSYGCNISYNNGKNWHVITRNGLPNQQINSILITPKYLFVYFLQSFSVYRLRR